MKWQGRQGSGNVEDRRGMSRGGGIAVGGGIGGIVILLIVMLWVVIRRNFLTG